MVKAYRDSGAPTQKNKTIVRPAKLGGKKKKTGRFRVNQWLGLIT